MLSKFKLSHKFMLMSLVQLSMIVVTGWVSITQMAKIGHEIEEIAYDHLPLTKTLTLITEHQLQQAILVEKVISHALLDELNSSGISQESISLANEVIYNLDKLRDEIIESEKFIEGLLGKVTLTESVKRYQEVLVEFRKVKNEFLQLEGLLTSFITKLKTENISQIYNEISIVEQSNDLLDEHLITILNNVQNFTEKSAEKAYQDEVSALRTILTVAGIAIALAIIIPFFIGSSILSSLKKLLVRLDDLVSGEGDLTIRMDFKTKDELGDVANKLDRFMDKLSRTIANISKSSVSLNKSSESAITVIQNTLSSVEKQSTETSMVANAVAEMNSATSDVAKSTLEASNLARQVQSVVTKGKAVAEDNQRITRQLNEEVQDTSTSLSELANETKNIGTVLDTIQSIAEQTNLLALNAAIEAARAGDSGRGFAVVADEVRSLAQKTQDSTIDIQNLVEKLQNGAKSAMLKMNKGVDITEQCLEIAKETAGHFDSAVEAVTEIADLNNQVAAASEQQSTIAEQVQQNIGNINGISQNTKRDAEEVAKANEDIAINIISLNTDLNQFKVEIV